jgi:S1-C subfamily serine protease
VSFSDGTVYPAELVALDPSSDLAVLTVPQVPEEKIKPLPLGNSTELKIGEQVATIGSPFDISDVLSVGVVAKLGYLFQLEGTPYSIPDTIVADLPVYPGNSGGPLFNMKGEVVGVTSGSFGQTSISFSVPSSTIRKVVPELIANGSFAYPRLGLSGVDVTPEIAGAIGITEEPRGFLVIDVDPQGPSAKSGIRGSSQNQSTTAINVDGREVALGGDVILAADGIPIRSIDDILGYILREKSVGDNIQLTIFRNGQFQDISVILEATSP